MGAYGPNRRSIVDASLNNQEICSRTMSYRLSYPLTLR